MDLAGQKTVKKRNLTQRKILPKRLKRLHRDFKSRHPQAEVSLRTMYRHLPKHIKTMRNQSYRQCLCEICVNVDLKLDALQQYMKEPINGGDHASEISLCQTPSLSCYNRKCADCGVKLVQCYIADNLTADPAQQPVKWQTWALVKKDKGQRREKITITGNLDDLIKNPSQDLTEFSKHIFTYRFQHMQYKLLMNSLTSAMPNKTAIAVCDFAENHLCKYQDEVQSAHWGYKYNQVTVHPTVLYYPCATCDNLVTEYIVFLSDDLVHDAPFVNLVLTTTEQHLNDLGIEKIVVWSDGCAAQYKSKLPFFYAAKSQNIERAFFGSRHGKGPCDACGGVIKMAVDRDVLGGEVVVQSAEEMFNHLTANYLLPDPKEVPTSGCCHKKRSFRLVKTSDIDRSLSSSALCTVTGTRQIHQLRGLGNRTISTRKLACFCKHCLGLDGQECDFKEFVLPWEVTRMKLSRKRGLVESSPEPSPTPEPLPPSPQASAPSCPSSRCPQPHAAEEPISGPRSNTEMDENERELFFTSLQEEMASCASFQDLKNTCDAY